MLWQTWTAKKYLFLTHTVLNPALLPNKKTRLASYKTSCKKCAFIEANVFKGTAQEGEDLVFIFKIKV